MLDNPEGSTAMEIREEMDLGPDDSNRLSMVLKSMVDDGTIERRGGRRASRYLPKA